MAKIIDAKTALQDKIDNGFAVSNKLYTGNINKNLTATSEEELVVPGSEMSLTIKNNSWKDTEAHNRVWNKIEDLWKRKKSNIATFDQSAYEELIDNIRIDVTRRRFQYLDLTTLIDDEITNPNFTKAVTLDEFLPYGAAFMPNNLRGEAVSLIDQKYGGTDTVTMAGYAVGWADTLENQLFNMDIFSMMKVNEAIARGYVGKRNDLSAGEIVGTTYNASQQVAAATTSGATPEELLYETLNDAIETLTNLKDPQTDQIITAANMSLLCYPGDVRRINRAINGQLNNSKGKNSNREPLNEISNIIPYFGDTIYAGEKAISYDGVSKNTAYLYVPGVASWTLTKRGLTQELGSGSVLNLSTDQSAWYFVQTKYRNEFFGSSDSAILADKGTGYGFIVEITLPS